MLASWSNGSMSEGQNSMRGLFVAEDVHGFYAGGA
jgi:hypothetical protein